MESSHTHSLARRLPFVYLSVYELCLTPPGKYCNGNGSRDGKQQASRVVSHRHPIVIRSYWQARRVQELELRQQQQYQSSRHAWRPTDYECQCSAAVQSLRQKGKEIYHPGLLGVRKEKKGGEAVRWVRNQGKFSV